MYYKFIKNRAKFSSPYGVIFILIIISHTDTDGVTSAFPSPYGVIFILTQFF